MNTDSADGRVASRGLPFSDFMERALYDPEIGFYAQGGQAGRRGDFVTSPEVGPLFGAVVARALDGWWRDLGEPDPFWVVEAGAGPGTLARAVAAAAPDCARVWRYVTVERSTSQRAQQPEFVHSRADLPDGPVTGVVLANELLDNLPCDLVYNGGPVLVVEAGDGWRLEPDVAFADCEPDCAAARTWLTEALGLLHRGRVVVIDYTDRRGSREWLRTYRGNETGSHPLDQPGSQDITIDVPVAQLAVVREPDVDLDQATWLRHWGLDDLVDQGRRIWHERADVGDLDAIRGRSRISEADALTDPAGLGGYTVLEWRVNAV